MVISPPLSDAGDTQPETGYTNMPRRGHRLTLAPGIYQDDAGVSLCVTVAGVPFEQRKRLGVPLDALVEARAAWVRELRENAAKRNTKGTLAGDIAEYIASFPPGRRRENAHFNLLPWVTVFGKRKRASITAMEIRTALAEMVTKRETPPAPKTLNHRRQELLNLYTALNGKSGANPVRDVPRQKARHDEPRGIPMPLVEMILKHIGRDKRCKTWLRLTVMARTGLPPAQIARIEPHDFDAAAKTLFVRPRRKGAGRPGLTLPLTRAAVAAVQALLEGGALGPWSRHAAQKAFKAAVVKARAEAKREGIPWRAPKGLCVYDIRHAFLTDAYRRTGDIRAVAELALHSDIRMTQRYTEAGVSETAQRAIGKMEE